MSSHSSTSIRIGGGIMLEYLNRKKEKDGRYSFYTLKETTSGLKFTIGVDELKNQMRTGVTVSGLKLTSDNRIILSNKESYKSNYKVYSGDTLKRFGSIRYKLKPRGAVKDIVRFCKKNSEFEEICGVTGVRGTGKTIALLHSIDFINDYDNTVYIEIQEVIDMRELISILDKYACYKYIFIDEITRVKNFTDKANIISSRYSLNSRVVVSGTNSYAIRETLFSSLTHRMMLVEMSHITYKEQSRLQGMNIDTYLKRGGVLDKNLQNGSADELVNELVIANIVNSIIINKGYYKKYSKMSKSTLKLSNGDLYARIKSIVFYIYYQVIFGDRDIRTIHGLRLKNFTEGIEVSKIQESYFLDSVGVSLNFNKEDLKVIVEILLKMNCIKEVHNYYVDSECQYYVTSPVITYRLFDMFKKRTGVEISREAILNKMFESVVMCDLIDKYGDVRYFFDGSRSLEIDSVCVTDKGRLICVEAKSGTKFRRCLAKASSIVAYKDENIVEKLIVMRERFEEIRKPFKSIVKSEHTLGGNKKNFVSDEVILCNIDDMNEQIDNILRRIDE